MGLDGLWQGYYPLHGGVNRIVAIAADAACIESAPSNSITVTQVAIPPLYTVGVTPTTVVVGTPVTLWATARGRNDPSGLGETTHVTVTLPSEPAPTFVGLGKQSDVGGESAWAGAGSVAGITDGKYNVPFEGVDADGQRNSSYHGLEVDQTPPHSPWLEQPRGTLYTRQVTATVGGTAEPGDVVVVRVGAGVTLTTTADRTEEGRWRLAAALVEGENLIRAQAQDRAGNLSGWSAAGLVVRDTQPPVVAAGGVEPAYARHGAALVITATLVDVNYRPIIRHGFSAIGSHRFSAIGSQRFSPIGSQRFSAIGCQ